MNTELANQYNYRHKKGYILERMEDQIFPEGKELDLTFDFGESVAKLPLQAVVTGSNRIKAGLTLTIDDLNLLGLYHNILDKDKRINNKMHIKWECKELPHLRELTLAWNGIMMIVITRTHEEYEDMDFLLNPGEESMYTRKWKTMPVPEQRISAITLTLQEPIELKPEYKLRYIIPKNENYLRGIPVDYEKIQTYLDIEEKEDEIKGIKKGIAKMSIHNSK